MLVLVALLLSAEPVKKPLDCGGGYTEIDPAEQPVPASHRRSPERCAAWRKAMGIVEAGKPKTKKAK